MNSRLGSFSLARIIGIIIAIAVIAVGTLFASGSVELASKQGTTYSTESSMPPSTSTPAETPTTSFSSSTSISNGSSVGLRLDLALSTFSNGTLKVEADEFNPSSSAENVTAANLWPLSRDALDPYNPCDIPEPLGFTLFSGFYTAANFTTATPLALYNTSITVSCTINVPSTYFSFRPSSSDAKEEYATDQGSSGTLYDGSISLSQSSLGYWTGPGSLSMSAASAFHVFSSNQTYTIMAGDEWGRTAFLYFRPIAPLTTSELSSSLCSYGDETGAGVVYLRVVWPQVTNNTFSVSLSRTGQSTDQFYCPGASFSLGNFSNPMQFKEISDVGGLLPWGCYGVVIRTNGGTPLLTTSGSFCVGKFAGSAYVTIVMPQFNATTTICPPGSSCAAPAE